MGAGRQFGHHAAERLVLVDLAAHDVGNDLAAPVGMPAHQRCRGFVATGLDP